MINFKHLKSEYTEQFSNLGKWLILSIIIGILVGSASALLLYSLEFATSYRESHLWIISLLPVAGLAIGLLYHYFGKEVVKGNNQIVDEYHKPEKIIPLKMAPLVLIGTFLTHLFGGSAGREGSAVQMGSAISDQFSRWFKLDSLDRKILLIIGISGGFASVFGTPLAGTVFALEVLIIGRMRYEAILPSMLTAYIANATCHFWNVHHTTYQILEIPEFTFQNIFWVILCGIIFGLGALVFSRMTHFWGSFFRSKIKYPPLRPFIGGIVIAVVVYFIGTRYIGLGIPVIQESFLQELSSTDFILKIVLTSFTLGAGFKGGEVTPLFFIGATLGNILVLFVPLPFSLLAAMGFVAVFSGATNTPLACILMGIELFGAESALYTGLACVVAYLFSGHSGIYSSQIIGSPKTNRKALKSKLLREL